MSHLPCAVCGVDCYYPTLLPVVACRAVIYCMAVHRVDVLSDNFSLIGYSYVAMCIVRSLQACDDPLTAIGLNDFGDTMTHTTACREDRRAHVMHMYMLNRFGKNNFYRKP